MHVILLCLAIFAPHILVQGADLEWWKTAVFYQIYPRSFKDSDNSGIGDIGGIIQKLDHLVETGVTAVWLSPIYTSPQVDHGYDISNFTDVDPLFGNLTILKQLVNKCHNHGIKVILDFVPNHSSDVHDWFIKSENRDAGYENYYIWKDPKSTGGPPNNWISNFHGSAWEFSPKRNQYYLHQFAKGQPDLNYREPRVVQEMKNVLVYWLDFGVDGFRMDIVPALFEHSDFLDEPVSGDPNATSNDHGYLRHIYTYDQPETYDMVYQWRTLLDNYQTEKGGDARVMMIETYSADDKVFAFYGNTTHRGAHFPFNFWFITKLNKNSNAVDIKKVVDEWLNYTEPHNYTANWVLGNHDQHRVASRYGTYRIEGLAMLTLMLPGIGVIYNGEEIGMENGEVTLEQGEDPQACNGLPEDFEKNSRDFERTPYQWDDTVNAGFNEGNKTWLPVGSKYQTINRRSQLVSGLKSYYRIYQALIQARKNDTIKYGKSKVLALTNNVVGLIRTHDSNPTYIIMVNVGDKPETVNLTAINNLPDLLTLRIASLYSRRTIGEVIRTKVITLDGYEALVTTGINEIKGNDTNSTNNDNGNSASTNRFNFLIMFMAVFVPSILLSNI